MDRETDIFDQDVQGISSGDLNVDLVNAGHVLNKLASEEGIDLNTLPDATVASLVRDILGGGGQNIETPKGASDMSQQNTPTTDTTGLPNEPTHADAAMELAKIAAANNIDLNTVSREEYTEAYLAVVERLSDPTKVAAAKAEAEKIAEAKAEEEAKLAAAYAHGERMAEGFLARLKVAEEEAKKDEKPEEKPAEGEKEASRYSGDISTAKSIAKGMLGKAKAHAGEIAGKAGDKGKALVAAAKEHGAKHKNTYAAGAGGAAAGAAAGEIHGRSKKASLDEEAQKLAMELAADMGYDPATGQKIAAAEPAAEPDFTNDDVAARAIEILKAANYPIGE